MHKTHMYMCVCLYLTQQKLMRYLYGIPRPIKGGAGRALQVQRCGRCNSTSPCLTEERRHLYKVGSPINTPTPVLCREGSGGSNKFCGCIQHVHAYACMQTQITGMQQHMCKQLHCTM